VREIIFSKSGDGLDCWSGDSPTPANRPRLSIDFYSPSSDIDNDGIPDGSDNCANIPDWPLIPDAEGGSSQQDDDGDDIGNACELRVATTSLPSGRAGNVYSRQLMAVRGQPSYTWTIISGAPPIFVTFNSEGLLFGEVLSTVLTFFTVQLTDDNGDTATQEISIRVTIPNCVNCHSTLH
jgi:hypothetical protein